MRAAIGLGGNSHCDFRSTRSAQIVPARPSAVRAAHPQGKLSDLRNENTVTVLVTKIHVIAMLIWSATNRPKVNSARHDLNQSRQECSDIYVSPFLIVEKHKALLILRQMHNHELVFPCFPCTAHPVAPGSFLSSPVHATHPSSRVETQLVCHGSSLGLQKTAPSRSRLVKAPPATRRMAADGGLR